MALVLGPELDVHLRGIGEDLKGKTILEEPYVDKKTIVHAVSEQNKVILALQTQVLQMQELEKAMQVKMSMMQDKLTYFEKYTEKVDVIEGILREKIPVVDKLDERVEEHSTYIENMSVEVKENAHDVNVFKDDTRDSFADVRKGIEALREDIELLPDSIIISSRQVTHSLKDEKGFSGSTPNSHSNDILADIIAQQEQHAFVQDKNTERIEQKFDDHVVSQSISNNEMKKDIHCLVDWKEAQSSVDLKSMKKHLDNLQTELESSNTILSKKMSKGDVERKLEHQFNEIVDHLQTALSSIENEEADFKCITDSLSKMCESLRESKADKSELTSLRKQFVTNQVGGGRGPLAGSTLDNEGIRKILSKYATKEEVFKLFDVCDDLDASESPIVGKIYSKIDNLRSMVLKLESVISNIVKYGDKGEERMDFEERQNPEDSRPSLRKRKKNRNINEPPRNRRISTIQEGDTEDTNHNKIQDMSISGSNSNNIQQNDDGSNFPSSNILEGVLSKVGQHEEVTSNDASPPLKNKQSSVRPLSAPPGNSDKSVPDLEKKHSLPAILTSTNKTLRPRSKMKSIPKNDSGRRIHKGSFQVIRKSPLEFGKSSDHFLTSLSSAEMHRPSSAEHRYKKNHGFLVRTSIE